MLKNLALSRASYKQSDNIRRSILVHHLNLQVSGDWDFQAEVLDKNKAALIGTLRVKNKIFETVQAWNSEVVPEVTWINETERSLFIKLVGMAGLDFFWDFATNELITAWELLESGNPSEKELKHFEESLGWNLLWQSIKTNYVKSTPKTLIVESVKSDIIPVVEIQLNEPEQQSVETKPEAKQETEEPQPEPSLAETIKRKSFKNFADWLWKDGNYYQVLDDAEAREAAKAKVDRKVSKIDQLSNQIKFLEENNIQPKLWPSDCVEYLNNQTSSESTTQANHTSSDETEPLTTQANHTSSDETEPLTTQVEQETTETFEPLPEITEENIINQKESSPIDQERLKANTWWSKTLQVLLAFKDYNLFKSFIVDNWASMEKFDKAYPDLGVMESYRTIKANLKKQSEVEEETQPEDDGALNQEQIDLIADAKLTFNNFEHIIDRAIKADKDIRFTELQKVNNQYQLEINKLRHGNLTREIIKEFSPFLNDLIDLTRAKIIRNLLEYAPSLNDIELIKNKANRFFENPDLSKYKVKEHYDYHHAKLFVSQFETWCGESMHPSQLEALENRYREIVNNAHFGHLARRALKDAKDRLGFSNQKESSQSNDFLTISTKINNIWNIEHLEKYLEENKERIDSRFDQLIEERRAELSKVPF